MSDIEQSVKVEKVKTSIDVPDLGSEKETTDVVLDGSPRGGDDDMLEGTEIKTGNFDSDWSESDSEV